MRYLSVCSGIEAASVAWHPLGWEPVGFSEIEKFPAQVLAHRFPSVKNYGDMTKYKEWDIEPGTVDLLVGGTPCQAFSVAGLRKGLADPRGNLALVFLGLADHFKPEWIVWENVPGVLSSNGGRDFGAFLGALGQLGYGWAYRTIDAQYSGTCDLHRRGQGWDAVPQRRRRVFVVAHSSGDPRRAAEVLFERESLCGDPPPSRETREGASGSLVPSVAGSLDTQCGGGKLTHQSIANGHLIGTITARMFNALGARDVEEGALIPIGLDEEQNASVDLFGTLKARTESGGFQGAVMQPSLYESRPSDSRVTGPVEQCPTIPARWGTGGGNTPLVADQDQVPFETTGLGDVRAGDIATTLRRNSGASGESQNAAYILVNPTQHDADAVGFAEDFNAIELTQTAPAMTTSGYSPTQNAGGLGALQCNAEQSAKAYSIAPGRQGTPEKVDDIHVTEQDTSRTLDGTCADPERRQGGTLIVQPSFAYDDRNQAVSTDTHHTLRGEAAGSRVGDAVVQPDSDGVISFQSKLSFSSASKDVAPTMSTEDVLATTQPGEASAFSWQCRGDMRGMVPRPTAQLQRCQIEAVMVPEQSGYETVPALTASGRGVERPGESRGQDPVVAVNQDAVQVQWASGGGQVENPTAQALRSNAEHNYQFVRQTMHVRRLTPVECERLQGFPDGWTDIRPNGKDTPDSPRYKALGNSMAVPVMRWIGMRIAEASRG